MGKLFERGYLKEWRQG